MVFCPPGTTIAEAGRGAGRDCVAPFSATPGRPACPSRASGWSSLTTPWGFPCCVRFPCVHAVATTPAQRLGALLRSSLPQPCQPSPTLRAQLGRRRLGMARRDSPALLVDEPGQAVDHRLGHVADHRQPAAHVAVEGAVADRQFRLVAGRQQQARRSLLDRAISRLPRMRAWRFSSVTSVVQPREDPARASRGRPGRRRSMGMTCGLDAQIARPAAGHRRCCPGAGNGEGMARRATFSGPRARAARPRSRPSRCRRRARARTLLEAALADVVAQARRQRLGRAAPPRAGRDGPPGPDAGLGRSTIKRSSAKAAARATTRPAGDPRRRLAAVEDQLVVAADLVARRPAALPVRAGGGRQRCAGAGRALPSVEGAGGDVDQQRRPCPRGSSATGSRG